MFWGIDLGGTKIEGVVVASLSVPPRPVARIRVDTPRPATYEAVLERIAELVRLLTAEVGEKPETIGFGTPGVLDPATGLLKNSNTQSLNGKPLERDLAVKLGCRVMLANDANCFALAEALLGAARGAECVFGVIMGTGVGGGLVFDGRVRYGAQGIAGEWGHNFLEVGGEECYCGKRGCVEMVLSGPALERYYLRRSGTALPLAAIAEAARSGGDDAAAETIDRLHRYFGRALATVVNIVDPDCVVLGGGVSNIESLYDTGIAELRRSVFNDSVGTRIVRNVLGDSAGVFGAAMLCCPPARKDG